MGTRLYGGARQKGPGARLLRLEFLEIERLTYELFGELPKPTCAFGAACVPAEVTKTASELVQGSKAEELGYSLCGTAVVQDVLLIGRKNFRMS